MYIFVSDAGRHHQYHAAIYLLIVSMIPVFSWAILRRLYSQGSKIYRD